jgi:hypothetical protein
VLTRALAFLEEEMATLDIPVTRRRAKARGLLYLPAD